MNEIHTAAAETIRGENGKPSIERLAHAQVFVLLTLPGSPDFFAALLIILSMQVMLRLNPRIGGLWIGLCALAWHCY